jgi:hypothetical protein
VRLPQGAEIDTAHLLAPGQIDDGQRVAWRAVP